MKAVYKDDLTAKFVKSILKYNSKSGKLRWRYRLDREKWWNDRYAYEIAGTIDSEGYIVVRINGRRYIASRLIWLIMTGKWPKRKVDHRDTNKGNNKWKNLRQATDSQNQYNKKLQKNNTSGYKGVSLHKSSGKWRSRIRIKNNEINLGSFITTELAHAAYCKAAKQGHRNYARFE